VLTPREAFVTYLDVVDYGRKLPFRDPGLPPDLLAADRAAPTATGLFEHLVRRLEGRALAHAAQHWSP
jgi:phenylacetic acid degradation operon negative regulatory protein